MLVNTISLSLVSISCVLRRKIIHSTAIWLERWVSYRMCVRLRACVKESERVDQLPGIVAWSDFMGRRVTKHVAASIATGSEQWINTKSHIHDSTVTVLCRTVDFVNFRMVAGKSRTSWTGFDGLQTVQTLPVSVHMYWTGLVMCLAVALINHFQSDA
jgi:hypothetical protein